MAWNEPGGSKGQDPWGGRNKQQGPPDLDEIVRKLQRKLDGLFGGKGKGRGGDQGTPAGAPRSIALIIAVLVGLWLLYDMVYIIQPAERGVVLRFGKYADTLMPGPNFRLPRPIERVERVDVDQIRSLEYGRGGPRAGGGVEGMMLTKDENIVVIQLAVQYKVKDARDVLFNVRQPEETLRSATESAIREVVGRSMMDFVLQEGRAEIAARTLKIIQQILDRYDAGLMVTTVNLLDAQPPEQVQEAFLDAIRAREDRDRLKNEALAYANEIIPRARGEAARVVEDANAYKARVVAESQGDASRFSQVLAEYDRAPKVTRERLYIETVESVLGKTSKVMVDVRQGNSLLYLPLDRILQPGGAEAGNMAPAPAVRPPLQPDRSLGPVGDERVRQNARGREVR